MKTITKALRRYNRNRHIQLPDKHEYVIDEHSKVIVAEGEITFEIGRHHTTVTEAEFNDFLDMYLDDRVALSGAEA